MRHWGSAQEIVLRADDGVRVVLDQPQVGFGGLVVDVLPDQELVENPADSGPACPHEPGQEILTGQPVAMADEQLNRRSGIRQSMRVKPQRRNKVLEAGSKSGPPSGL